MDLKQLLYYVAIVEEGTMSAAAKKLYVGQPLLSYQLKALEDEFGVQLIERGPRRIRLTDAGAAFYQRARHMLGLSELTEQTMADFQRGLTGTLSLGTQYSSASLLLTPALIAFYNAHPRIHLVVQSGRTFELINQLLDGLIDIAIVHVPFDASDALDCLYMPHEHIMAVAHHHLLPASNQSIPLCQLRDLPLILNKSLRPRIEAACAMLGFIPRIFCSTDDGRTALLWANADLGVAVVSQSVVDVISLGPQMHACPIDGPLMHTQCALLWRKRETYTSELARAFIQTFKQAYQTAPFTK